MFILYIMLKLQLCGVGMRKRHEVGVYDLKAMIDFILEQTNQTQLIYTGYSQGGTSIFVLLSEHPEYNEKIASIHLMAAAVFYTKSNPIITPLLKNINTIKVSMNFQYFIVCHILFYSFSCLNDISTSVYSNKLNCMR